MIENEWMDRQKGCTDAVSINGCLDACLDKMVDYMGCCRKLVGYSVFHDPQNSDLRSLKEASVPTSSPALPTQTGGPHTLDVDQHVLGRDLSQAAQAGQAEEGVSQGCSGPVDGEALLYIKGDVYSIHWDFLWGELPVQCHVGQRIGHQAGKQDWLMAVQPHHLIIILGGDKELLWVWEGRRERGE